MCTSMYIIMRRLVSDILRVVVCKSFIQLIVIECKNT